MVFDDIIQKNKNICILGHINPDGDCVGSVLAIYNYIINKFKNEKNVKIYLEHPNEKFNCLPNFDKISSNDYDNIVFDLAIVCDCSSKDRIKQFCNYLNTAKNVFVIDHHETNEFDYKNMIIDSMAPATCQIIYDLLDKQYINKDVAKCIYLGIAHDTGVFRYSNTNKRTFEIISEIYNFDINFNKILEDTIFTQTISQKKIAAMIFSRAEIYQNGKVIFGYVLANELEEFGLGRKDIDRIVGSLLEIENIILSAFTYEISDKIFKISLRSKNETINCAEISKKYGGGGHKNAAGFTFNGSLSDIRDIIKNIT